MNECEYLMDLIRRYGISAQDLGRAEAVNDPDALALVNATYRLYDRIAYDLRRVLERGKDAK